MRRVWISNKKWEDMEKRIAALEFTVQEQRTLMKKHIKMHEKENQELKEIIPQIKEEIYWKIRRGPDR